MLIAALAALGSALLVAVASVLQHRAGAAHPQPTLRAVVRSPLWIIGSAAGIAGFVLHAVALSTGDLSFVQPLLVSGLLFALPLSCVLDHRRVRRSDLAAAVAVVGGLTAFQLTARPAAGAPVANLTALSWCVLAAVGVSLSAFVMAIRHRAQRAAWLGLCAGAGYGLVAALMKTTIGVFDADGIAVLKTWPLYAFLAVVAAAIAVNQLAFNAGPLSQSLPLVTIVDPIVAIAVGAVAFGEVPSTALLPLLGQITGFVSMSVGVLILCRSTSAAQSPATAMQPDRMAQLAG